MNGRVLASWVAYPGLLVAALLAGHLLVEAGASGAVVVMGVSFAAALPVLALQLWMPYADHWRGRPQDFGIDLLHGLLTGAVGDAWRAVTFGVTYSVSAILAAAIGATLWPTEWPLLAQFALALLVGDLGAYWVHRVCHTVPLFWRVHAMHHTSERLYAFSATRSHPANVVLAWGSQALPLILLGCPEPVLVLMSVFTAVHGLLQHANIDLRHGWLNHVFATADLHRWHHSADMVESNSNYGSNLIVWDVVFGTRHLPSDRRHPARTGLDGMAIPENWFSHLALPFVFQRYTVQDAVALAEELTELPDLAELGELDEFTLEGPPGTPVHPPRHAAT